MPEDVAKRVINVASFRHHVHAGLFEQEAQAATDDGVVVGQHDADRGVPRDGGDDTAQGDSDGYAEGDRQGPLVQEEKYRQLLTIGRQLVEELDVEKVLRRVLDVARDVTGAQYAALGVLDENGETLKRFLTAGVDEETHARIGDLPSGRGVLGELIRRPEPLRLAAVGDHPRSYGFPPGHPPMTTFLGAPVMIRDEPFGNIYLTDKEGGQEFDAEDEEALVVLADWSAVAIDNARLHERVAGHRDDLERAVDTLSATTTIARALAGETDLDRVLELIAKRGRAVAEARSLVIMLASGDELVVAAGAGELPEGVHDTRIPIQGSIGGEVLRTGRSQRLNDINRARFEQSGLGAALGLVPESGLFVPLVFRQRPIGVLVALDRAGGDGFTGDHERLLEAFAVSASTAVGTAQNVSAGQRRRSLQATEAERRRWARELHDETLQELAALRLSLALGARSETVEDLRDVMRSATTELDARIAGLRALISDVRPASLDQLGTASALEELADRTRARGLTVTLDVDLDFEAGRAPERHVPELEDALYRLTQEALTNALKHADATSAQVSVHEHEGRVELKVRDDGKGFSPAPDVAGFGIVGMRERVELLGGSLELLSAPGGGTLVRAMLPSQRRGASSAPGESVLETG